ncbi:MAG: bifunctional diguanylate cyclase/phosphodiesterase [Lachnospiraceae bacterium]|nr:bifunctional diguanylate cyclase/phosphodiesterase [Lachnospiraceae bacterium]
MIEKIKVLLGIEKKDPYVRDYMESSNMRAVKYMCSFVIFVETWMIFRIIRIVLFGIETRSPEWIKVHLRLYILLIISSILMLLYALAYLRGKLRSHVITQTFKGAYCLISVVFGIYVSYLDYIKGEQIMGFLTMVLFVTCLLVWPPLISVLIITASFGVFYYLCDLAVPATVATDVNMFTTYIAMVMISIGNYRQRKSEALKDAGLEYTSTHDDLTGILNMYFFREEAGKRFKAASSRGESLALIYFDIVNFKTYNERYGFTEGNRLLANMADVLKEIFPDGIVARLSDDHFIVLAPPDDPEKGVQKVQEKLVLEQGDVYLGIKAGIYLTDGMKKDKSGVEDINILCDRSRFAVKSIKHTPDICCFFDEELHELQRRKHYIVSRIDKAIEQGHIRVYYQPIIDAKSGKACALEALARWDDPEKGLLSPGVFIETLEEYRQIHKLDIHIIEIVCRDLKEFFSKWEEVLPVSVNLSRLDFELCDIASEVRHLAEKYEISSDLLEIEITESALSHNPEELDRAMNNFRIAKHNLWLDDFGAGYSSFNVLKDYSFDVLKIDMKFLEGFGKNERFEPIMQSIITLCDKLGMLSLAEGVETEEEYEFLKKCGCCRVQGYYFSKPVPIDKLQRVLAEIHFEGGG